jgi:hypothetical protein
VFFPVGTDRPARRRPAALDRPVTPVPCYGPAVSPKHSVTPVHCLCTDCTLSWLKSHEVPDLPAFSLREFCGCLCASQYLPALACIARGAPPSPRCTRGTNHPAAADAAAQRAPRAAAHGAAAACFGTSPSGSSIRTCTCLSASRPAPKPALQSFTLLPCGCCRIPMASGNRHPPPLRHGGVCLIPVAIRQQPQYRLLPLLTAR